MSVQSTETRESFDEYRASETDYPVRFPFADGAHLEVSVIPPDGLEERLVYGVDFTVVGSMVRTVRPIPRESTVVVWRNTPQTQLTQWRENDAFPAKASEDGLDKLTFEVQELLRKVRRCMRVSDAAPEVQEVSAGTPEEDSVLVFKRDGSFAFQSYKKITEEISYQAAVPAMRQALLVMFPVGGLYLTTREEHPFVTFGFGEWRRWGPGWFLISVDPEDPRFAKAGIVGGEEAHTLTPGEVPMHLHAIGERNIQSSSVGNHNHPTSTAGTVVNIQASGFHRHNYKVPKAGGQVIPTKIAGSTGSVAWEYADTFEDVLAGEQDMAHQGWHSHKFELPATQTTPAGAHAHLVNLPESQTGAAGGGESGVTQAHNNVPMFICIHAWVRVDSNQPDDGGELPAPFPNLPIHDTVRDKWYQLNIRNGVLGAVEVEVSNPDELAVSKFMVRDEITQLLYQLVIKNGVVGGNPVDNTNNNS